MRYGEMTAFEERPHSPYYGCADATALYVVLLDEYERWTGDRKLVRELEQEARAALNWIDEYADLMGNGYVSYQRRNEKTGLENQCWKDSWDSISYRDGRLPGIPAGDLRAAGLRLRREDPRRPARPRDLEGPGVRRRAREAGGRSEAPLQPRLLGRGRSVLRARAGRGRQPGRRAQLEQRPPALERHRRQVEGEGGRPPPARTAAVHRLGRTHPGRGRRTLQPDRLPRRHDLAVRQLVHRLGPAPLRLQGGSSTDRGRHPQRRRLLRRSSARSVRRLRAGGHQVPGPVPDRLQPAGLVDRRAAAVPANDARPRADRRPPRRRPRAPERHRRARPARDPRPLGPRRRLRTRADRANQKVATATSACARPSELPRANVSDRPGGSRHQGASATPRAEVRPPSSCHRGRLRPALPGRPCRSRPRRAHARRSCLGRTPYVRDHLVARGSRTDTRTAGDRPRFLGANTSSTLARPRVGDPVDRITHRGPTGFDFERDALRAAKGNVAGRERAVATRSQLLAV